MLLISKIFKENIFLNKAKNEMTRDLKVKNESMNHSDGRNIYRYFIRMSSKIFIAQNKLILFE